MDFMRTVSAMRMASAALAVAVTALSSTAASANLIQNGDFSTGDFTDWTVFTTTNVTREVPYRRLCPT